MAPNMGILSMLINLLFVSLATFASAASQSVSASDGTGDSECTQSILSAGTMVADCLLQTTTVMRTSVTTYSSSLTTGIATSTSPTFDLSKSSTSTSVAPSSFLTEVTISVSSTLDANTTPTSLAGGQTTGSITSDSQMSMSSSVSQSSPSLIAISIPGSPTAGTSTTLATFSSAEETLTSSSETLPTQAFTSSTTLNHTTSSMKPLSPVLTTPTTSLVNGDPSTTATTQSHTSPRIVTTKSYNITSSQGLTTLMSIISSIASLNTTSTIVPAQATLSGNSTSNTSPRSWTTLISPIPRPANTTSASITTGLPTFTSLNPDIIHTTFLPLTAPFQNETGSSLATTEYGSVMSSHASFWSNSTEQTHSHSRYQPHTWTNGTTCATGDSSSLAPDSSESVPALFTTASSMSFGDVTSTRTSSGPSWPTGMFGNHTHTGPYFSTSTIQGVQVVTNTRTVYSTVTVLASFSLAASPLGFTATSAAPAEVMSQISDGQVQASIPTTFVTSPVLRARNA